MRRVSNSTSRVERVLVVKRRSARARSGLLPAWAAISAFACAGAPAAYAAGCVWDGTVNSWTSSADWGGACANVTYPGNGNTDDASITAGNVSLTVGLTAGSVTVGNAG
jgi:hypothetical protein